ncbi:MAG: C4-type zinc ribbon domain-containing protein [Desulfatibacillaceae bacterium]|nr:C4-type zinc ribbon domain-containing protein [Desulfatibacillaceae bacterium]
MREQICKLVKLQSIDNEAAKVQVTLAQCNKKLDKLTTKVADIRSQVASHQEKRDDLARRQRMLESEVVDVKALRKKSQERLMSIKNAREYKALQREIDDSKRKVDEMENQLVEYMEQMEQAEASLALLGEELAALEDALAQETKSVDKERSHGQKRLGELDGERISVSQSVEPDIFARYSLVLRSTGGIAVVPVESQVCKGCNMNIPPQIYNELQRGDELKMCPHCERIIYWQQNEQE